MKRIRDDVTDFWSYGHLSDYVIIRLIYKKFLLIMNIINILYNIVMY